MLRIVTPLISLSLVAVLSSAQAAVPVSVVRGADNTTYVGVRNTTSNQDYFLGIPYAQPPVGSLRFRPPVAWVPGNITEVNATYYGASCEQSVQLAPIIDNPISEDCLTLNIYGGGFYTGDTLRYPGTFLVEKASEIGKPIIYVSMNYRVGVYGFPPGQAAYNAGGRNLALQDQGLALQWVHQNIGYFGGDLSKVTVFGTSAGAISAGVQTFYGKGKTGGLFRGIILESGSPETIRALKPNDPVREAAFQLLVNATGCSNNPSPFECMRNAPANILSQANKDVITVDPYYRAILPAPTIFGPTYAPEDEFITEPVHDLLDSGKFAIIPFINGAQLDEGMVFADGPATNISTERDIINWLTAPFPGLYFGISNMTAAKELVDFYPLQLDRRMVQETRHLEEVPNTRDLPVYSVIYYSMRPDGTISILLLSLASSRGPTSSLDYPPQYGIAHGGDFPFVLQTLNINHPDASPGAVQLMKLIGDY